MPTTQEVEAEAAWGEVFAPPPPSAMTAPESIPEGLRRLPVASLIGTVPIEESGLVLTADVGSGKTMVVPAWLCQEFKARGTPKRILLRCPTRLTCRFVYEGLKKFWGDKLRIGISTSRQKEGIEDAEILIVSDGSASKFLTDGTPQVFVVDETHWLMVPSEIEIGLAVTNKVPVVLLSATVDPAPLVAYLTKYGTGPAQHLHIAGRLFPIENHMRLVGEEVFDRNKEVYVEERGQTMRLLDLEVEWAVKKCHTDNMRGIMFLPTKALCEDYAKQFETTLPTTFAHGEVPPTVLEEWIAEHPTGAAMVFATSAASTGITISVDYCFIYDEKIGGGRSGGVTFQTAMPIDQNMILQMRGRVGRLRPGDCWLITTQDRRPRGWDGIGIVPIVPPCGESTPYEVVLTMASEGMRDFENAPLLSKLDTAEVRHARGWLEKNRCIAPDGGLLTMGQRVKNFPMDVTRAHMVLSAPSQQAKLVVLAATCLGEKGTFSLLRIKPGKLFETYQAKHPEFKLMPDECVVQGSMPMTLASLMQRAFKARDRSNKEETLAGWCYDNNINERAMKFAMMDFEEAGKHIIRPRARDDDDTVEDSYSARTAFMALDLPPMTREVNQHLKGHREFIAGRFAARSAWGPTDLGNGIVDSAAHHLFSLGGRNYSAYGIPKEVRTRSGSSFISMEMPIVEMS